MARARRLPAPEPALDETGIERDFVMARLMAARASLQAAMEAVDEAAAIFVNPDDDPKGKERKTAVGEALEATGVASRALEAAEGHMTDFEREDWAEREPWEEDEEPEDEDDDEDEEDDDDD